RATATIGGGVGKTCEFLPAAITIASTGTQPFLVTCKNNGVETLCPQAVTLTTDVQGGSVTGRSMQGNKIRATLQTTNAPSGQQGKKVYASGDGYSCAAQVTITQPGASPSPSPTASPSPGRAVSCLISPNGGALPQGGVANFVASCFDVANPLSLGAALNQHRVDCPHQMTWTTTLSGVTLYSPGAVGANKVNAFVATNALAPQSGSLKVYVGGPGNKQAPVTPPAQQAPSPSATPRPSPSPTPRTSVNPLLPQTSGAAAGRSELDFAETQQYFECSVPLSITSACFNGWKTETHSLAANALVRVGDYEFKLEDSSATKAIVFGRTAGQSLATNWDLCGSRTACEIPLRGTLEMPINADSSKVKAKVTFLEFVSVAQEVDRTAKAILKIAVVCPSTEPSCSITPNPAIGTGPFSQSFTVAFKNVFGDAVTQPPYAATVSCRDDADVPPVEAVLTRSGAGGSASFNCSYPTVQQLTYYTARASFGGAACSASVQDNAGSAAPGVPKIVSPKEGEEYWANKVPLTFVVAGSGNYYCEYALYSKEGSKSYSIGAVRANEQKTIDLSVTPSGYWVRVRCSELTPAGLAQWKESQTVRFLVFEPDRPVLVSPQQNYRHFGLSTPFKAKFKIRGTQASYSCYYVLDGKTFSIGDVNAGEKEFFVGGLEPQVWLHGQRHLLSVRCASRAVATVLPGAIQSPTQTPPAPSALSSDLTAARSPSSLLEFAEAQSWPALHPGEKESAIQGFTTFEADKPVILVPVEGGVYNSPVELAFVVGGSATSYECKPAFDGIDEESVVVAASTETKIVKQLNSGVHKASVKCKAAPSQQQETGSAGSGSQGVSVGPAPNWISSGDVSFRVVNRNQPIIIHPEEGQRIGGRNVDFVFKIGGDYLAFDCKGYLKPAFSTTNPIITVDFGRVTRESCALPKTVSKLVQDVPFGKYEARVQCTPVLTIRCENVAESGVAGGVQTVGASGLSFADGGVWSDPVTFELAEGGASFINKPLVSSPANGQTYVGTNVTLTFTVTGSSNYASFQCAKTLDGATTAISGFAENGVPYSSEFELVNLALSQHELRVSCRPIAAQNIENTSDAVVFTMTSGSGGGGGGGQGGAGGSGGSGGQQSCTKNEDCGLGGICVAGFCNWCLCLLDGYCNPCCLPGTDKDCGSTAKSQETLYKPVATPSRETEFEWPTATPPAYAPRYSLSLKCAVGADKKVTAVLTRDGAPACDADMRLAVGKRVLAPDASECAAKGEHYFDVSGIEPGSYSAKATSLGGSSATCKLAIAAAAGLADWMVWLVLALVIIAIAAGAYYYYKKKTSAGKASGEESAPAEESTDLLEES
ncbi:MAG: hypothetical protein QW343_03520, partial [Candidatus Norongarragalinales archaeon]